MSFSLKHCFISVTIFTEFALAPLIDEIPTSESTLEPARKRAPEPASELFVEPAQERA